MRLRTALPSHHLFSSGSKLPICKRAYLRRASLQGGSSFAKAHLEESNLQEANLEGNNLQGAHLQRANLQRANLRDTNLTNADLSRADLSEATGWTAEQLDQAKSLKVPPCPTARSTRTGSRTAGRRRRTEALRNRAQNELSRTPIRGTSPFQGSRKFTQALCVAPGLCRNSYVET